MVTALPAGPLNGFRLIVLLFALCVLAAFARGSDDKDDRDRKARVALALAGNQSANVGIAPMPRVASLSYPAGYAKASADLRPLVVFVGCNGHPPVEGAVVAKVDSFGDVKGPAVVVGYPVGDRLYIDATFQCPVEQEQLAAAVKAAGRKIDRPADKGGAPAPKPLKWDI